MALDYLNIATSTFQSIRKNLADSVFLANKLSRWLLMNGRVKTIDGGKHIETSILYGKNPTVRSYRGYDTLPTSPTEEMTMAKYNWRQMAGSATMSGYEKRINAGAATRIHDLWGTKAMVLQKSFQEAMNDAFLAATVQKDLSRDILGLEQIMEPVAAASQGHLGGIDVADTLVPGTTRYWWASKFRTVDYDDAGTLAPKLYTQMNSFLNDLSEGRDGGRPDLILTTQRLYEKFEIENADKMRYAPSDLNMLNVGFDSQRFKGITMMWDTQVRTAATDGTGGGTIDDRNRMYFIRSQDLNFTIHRDANFTMTPFREPVNQDAQVAYMLLMGNLICENRRHQGMILWNDVTA